MFIHNRQCKNNPSDECAAAEGDGPISSDYYNLMPNTLPRHDGWCAAQSISWNKLSGLSCRAGLSRCGFNLHLESFSEGCITFDRHNPQAVQEFNNISNLLQNDAPNTLTVFPYTPFPGL